MLLQTSTASSGSTEKGDDAQKVVPLWTSATAIFFMGAALVLSDQKDQPHSISLANCFKSLVLFFGGGMVGHIYGSQLYKSQTT